jgi:hypothetical protein
MPAPKKPNTAAATAAVRRRGQETMAAKLRAAGWTVAPPEQRNADYAAEYPPRSADTDTGILPDAHRCAGCSFTTASADRMDGHLRATGHTHEGWCECDWLGIGTPWHLPSPMCRSLRPDGPRSA